MDLYEIITRIRFKSRNIFMSRKRTSYLIYILLLSLCLMSPSFTYAEVEITGSQANRNNVYSPLVHTLQVIANGDWMQPAVIGLDSEDEFVTVSFDYFSHEYHRLCCHLVHCDADGSPSELMESEYMDGFNDRPIEYYMNSLNTTFLYTHYAIDFPNENVFLKVSGNYCVFIYDEELDVDESATFSYRGHPVVAVAWFKVVEPLVNITAEVSSNTDVDTHVSHQQVSFVINHPEYAIERPERELKVFVTQNNRPELMVANIQPTYIRPERLEYVHNKHLIFQGGNEFRRFEIINMHYGFQHVDKIDFYDPYYHAILMSDNERRAYSFDADHNGRFLVRYNMAEDDDTEADYVFAHFSLEVPHPFEHGQMYVIGCFSNFSYSPAYQMNYNSSTSAYECTALLKMGAYDYQYVFVPDDTSVSSPEHLFDGNFYETENEYTISVYHRPFGTRYDRLIAVEIIDFSQE